MNWIRPEKRLAIYLRDGMACCYCGRGVESGTHLTLDHMQPFSSGGSNKPTNLITCCNVCNCARGNRSWKLFAAKLVGADASEIIARILTTRRRAINVPAAKKLMTERGGFRESLGATL